MPHTSHRPSLQARLETWAPAQVWLHKEQDSLEGISLLPESQLDTIADLNAKVIVTSFQHHSQGLLSGWKSVSGGMAFVQNPEIMQNKELQFWQAGQVWAGQCGPLEGASHWAAAGQLSLAWFVPARTCRRVCTRFSHFTARTSPTTCPGLNPPSCCPS